MLGPRRPCAPLVLALTLAFAGALSGCAPAAAPTAASPSDAAASQADRDATPTEATTDPRARLPALGEVLRLGPELVVQRVAKDAFVVTHELAFGPANVLVAHFDDDSILIASSPYHTDATRSLLAWIDEAFDAKRIVAINTHFHADGTGGNEAYAAAGVETYASDHSQRLLRERGDELRAGTARAAGGESAERILRTPIVAASHTFPEKDGLQFSFGGEAVHVRFPGASHSPDHVVVHVPSRSLLFGGCMIKSGSTIGFTGDADLTHWDEAALSLEELGATVVIPGHGPVGGASLLTNTATVVRGAREAKASPTE